MRTGTPICSVTRKRTGNKERKIHMAAKYYAVRKGLVPGIYTAWPECEAAVKGYPNAQFRGFRTEAEAQAYMAGGPGGYGKEDPGAGSMRYPYAFVDGSYNSATGVYGWGGFLVADGSGRPESRHLLQGSGSDPELASMHNVAGEVSGCMAAVRKALELGLGSLSIYYDYTGIEYWARGEWKANRTGTKAYAEFMRDAMRRIGITFHKVAAHTGVDGNEEADRLAKEAAGLQ